MFSHWKQVHLLYEFLRYVELMMSTRATKRNPKRKTRPSTPFHNKPTKVVVDVKPMQAEMTTIGSIKRRKTDHAVATTCLSDLPIGALEHAASFLAPPSRALFAVALTTDGNHNPPSNNNHYSSIAGSDWEKLDFGDIENDLAARLSDDDLSAVLQHIDAVNNVKRLRLTNCTNITGVGLEPLRGSTIIELLDLSLHEDCQPVINPEPPISCELVLPILDSIINENRGCALKYLEFPYKWRKNRSTDSEFHQFITRYNYNRHYMPSSVTISCLRCNHRIPFGFIQIDVDRRTAPLYGKHRFTCSKCTKRYCYDCHDDNDAGGCKLLGSCGVCHRDSCWECKEVSVCHGCAEYVCNDCSGFVCDGCKRMFCCRCYADYEDEVLECSKCDAAHCKSCDCACFECGLFSCLTCQLHNLQEGSIECALCIKMLPPKVLLDQMLESRRLKHENERLKLENKELKDAIKSMVESVNEEDVGE